METSAKEPPKKSPHKIILELGQSVTQQNNRLSCNICGKDFDGQYKLKRHMQSHTGIKDFVCNTCGKGFAEQYKLKRHLVSHPESDQLHQMLSSTALPSSPKGFPCDTCGKVFPEQYKLKRHLLTHANNVEVKQTLALLTGIKTHSCEKCGKSFTEQAKLKRHMLTHSSEQPSVSVIEKSDISTNSNFVIRLNSATTLTRVKPKNQTVVKEDENSNDDIIEVTRVVPALENPQITELVANAAQEGQTMNDFSCNICGKEFDGMYKLNRHLVTHTGIKNFNCETCGKSFSEAYKLRRHLLVHAGIKMFPCDLCEKSYTRNDHLKRHKHEQHFQNFTCEVCSQEFDDKRALSNHRRIHNPQALKDANKPRTPEKPKGYPCPLCKIEYPDIETCHAHMKSLEHGWKNVHTCEVCHKSFLRKCHLNVHEKIHSDNRPFGCSECGRKFYRSDHLKAHLKTHTNDFKLNGEMSYNMTAAMAGSDPSSDGDSSNHHQGLYVGHQIEDEDNFEGEEEDGVEMDDNLIDFIDELCEQEIKEFDDNESNEEMQNRDNSEADHEDQHEDENSDATEDNNEGIVEINDQEEMEDYD